VRSLHGGGVALTGFRFEWLKKYDEILEPISKKMQMVLSKSAAIFFWYGAARFCYDAWNFYEDGEDSQD